MKLWGGRFSGEQDESMKQFNDSFHFDRRLYEVDIRGSRAYAGALHRAGLISSDEYKSILKGLQVVLQEFQEGRFESRPGDEDVHTAVERRLTELIGAPAGKLHTGRSRNDQVALDLRLYLLEVIEGVRVLLGELQLVITHIAAQHITVVMPGYTHLQPAQPVLFSHWLMSYFWMFERDRERLADCAKRTAVSPLGSGALAGNPFDIDRAGLAESLGLPAVSQNSMDAVSDRDFAAEFQFAAAMISVHISRLAEDLILYASPGFAFVTIADAYSTGSSLMPQKRNPDSLELARGKAGRVISGLVNLLVVLKGIPSTYNKDMQEDKEPLFDTIDTLGLVLPVLIGVVGTLTVHPEKMAAGLDESMLATDLAEYLVRKGVPFRQAHHLVGEVIRLAETGGLRLSEIPLQDLQRISPVFSEDVADVFSFEQSIAMRNSIGGTAPEAVRAQINEARNILEK